MFGRFNMMNDPFNDPFFTNDPFAHHTNLFSNNDPFISHFNHMQSHMNSVMQQHNTMFNHMMQINQQQPMIQHQSYNDKIYNRPSPHSSLSERPSNVQIEEIPNDNNHQQSSRTMYNSNNNTRIHVEEADSDNDDDGSTSNTIDDNRIAVHHINTDRYGNTHTRISNKPYDSKPQYYSESYSSSTVMQSNGTNQQPIIKQQSRHTSNINGIHETRSSIYDSERDYRASGIQRGINNRSVAAVQQQSGNEQPVRNITYNGVNENEVNQFNQQWNQQRHAQFQLNNINNNKHSLPPAISSSTVPPPLPATPAPQYHQSTTPPTRTVSQAQLPQRGSSLGQTQQQRPHIDINNSIPQSKHYDANRYASSNNNSNKDNSARKVRDAH